VTELNDDPHITRYLITVDSNGTTLQTVNVEGKALIDSEAARNLVRDMNQMRIFCKHCSNKARITVPIEYQMVSLGYIASVQTSSTGIHLLWSSVLVTH